MTYFFSGAFERLLSTINANLVTEVFIITSIILFAGSVFLGFKGMKSSFVLNVPTLLTSMGILGTFMGIVIGLIGFDSNNIDASVPLLLGGLKTAFNTSLVGMSFAILFKLLDNFVFIGKRLESGEKDDVSPKDIYAVMAKQNNLTHELIVSQKENSERLWNELNQFAEMMSKSATEQVVEALNNVIADFNTNLIEQFGSNFKALDESVHKLVVWQEEHVGQLDAMIKQYAEGVKTISQTSQAIESIGEQCVQIPSAMGDLKDVLDVNQQQIEELHRHLEAFVIMRDKATEAVPQIQSSVTMVSDQLMQGASQMREVMVEGATQFSESVQGANVSLLNTGNQIQTQSGDMSQLLQDTASEMNNSLRNVLATMSEEMTSMKETLLSSNKVFSQGVTDVATKMADGLDSTIRKSLSDTGAAVDKSVAMLDDSMQQEINKAMSQLGGDLTSITRMFLKDYKELTENMKRVVSTQVT